MLVMNVYQKNMLVLYYLSFLFYLLGHVFILIQVQMMEAFSFAAVSWWAKQVGPDILIVLGPILAIG